MNAFFEPLWPAQIGPWRLTEVNSSIAKKVLRLKANDSIELLNGKGGIGTGEIRGIQGSQFHVEIVRVHQAERLKRRVSLFQAFPKKDKAEWIVQKATELGVDEITFFLSDRSVKRPAEIHSRMEKIILEAMRQSRNPFQPEVGFAPSLSQALDSDRAHARVYADLLDDPPLLFSKLSSFQESISIYIGPEGGWSLDDRNLFKSRAVSAVRLTPYTLRTETAAIVALAVIRAKP